MITGPLDRCAREFIVGTFEFLQADDVWLGSPEPLHEIGEAAIDIVDVEGGNFHRHSGGAQRVKSKGQPRLGPPLTVNRKTDYRRKYVSRSRRISSAVYPFASGSYFDHPPAT